MNSELSIVKAEPSICDTEFEWDTNKNISKFCNSLNFLSNNMTHFKASFLDFVKNADSIFFQENSFELHFETTYVKPLQHLQTIVHQDIYENLDITKSQQINILNLFLNTAWNLEDLFIWTEKEISTYQKEGQHQNAFLPKKLHFVQNEIKKIEKSSHKISELLEVLTGFNLNIKRLIEKKVHEISNSFIDSAEATLNNTQYGLQQRVDAYQEVIKGLTNRINDIELEINREFIKNPQMPHNYQKELLNLYLIALSNWDKVCTRLLNIISSNTGYGNDDRKAMNDLTQELQQYILDKIASTQTNLDKISIAPLLEKIRDTMMKYNKQNHSLFSEIVDTFDHKISDENYQQIKKNLENFKKFLNNIKDATVINNFKKIEKVKVDLINALMSIKHIISSTDNTEYQLAASEISEDELQQKRNQYFKAIKDNFNQIEEIFLKLFNKYQNDFNAYDKLNFTSKNANITNKDFWTDETELSDFEVKINQVSSFINEWIGYFNNKDTENKWIKEKEKIIAEKNQLIKEKEKIIKEKDQLIAARDELITENHKLINDKDTTEEEKEKLKDRNKELEKEKNKLIRDKEQLEKDKEQLEQDKKTLDNHNNKLAVVLKIQKLIEDYNEKNSLPYNFAKGETKISELQNTAERIIQIKFNNLLDNSRATIDPHKLLSAGNFFHNEELFDWNQEIQENFIVKSKLTLKFNDDNEFVDYQLPYIKVIFDSNRYNQIKQQKLDYEKIITDLNKKLKENSGKYEKVTHIGKNEFINYWYDENEKQIYYKSNNEKRIIDINIPQLKAPNIKIDSIKIKEVNVGYNTNKDSIHYENIWSQETSQGIKQLNIIKNHFQQQKAFTVTWNAILNYEGTGYVWTNAYSGDLDWGKGQSMDEFFSAGNVNHKEYFYQKSFWFNITYEVETLIDDENINTQIKDYEKFINEINKEIKSLKNIIKS